MPPVQPMTAPRWRRQASPQPEARRGDAVAGPGRVGTTPAPKSRRPNTHSATAKAKAAPATSSSIGHHLSPENAYMPWYQPIGDIHVRNGVPTSPMARST